ncbi:serine O-acetyltransferase EpsC [Brachyspira innocens]|uniref:Serine O-acetyltransferase EpsC n=1 Tax=Brachyspira innocens TaxID=13264 RepID=A0ABT8YV51_9SPIR|nr:serine O-acetyltransferase EpsC [Brachyspira innocens]MDO6993425.1 serine O-acetyltransferase EpsC [Brachyspira innocens]MDO7019777.1 serine O-acetyltransferase EpsC [Brachyspira innocens]
MKLKTFNELPNQKDIKEIVKLIRDYAFPNFFRESPNKDIVKKNIAKLYMNIVTNDSYLLDFIEQLDDITLSLQKDLEFFYQSDPASKSYDEIVLTYPGFRAIFHYRIAHIFYNQNEYLIARTISEFAHSKTGIDIHPGATIGDYFFIDHGTGIVIGETTVIGHHVKIYQGVTLGALSLTNGRSLEGLKRHPTVCDYVTIYANASIFGGNTVIGENAIIGANCIVLESVEENKRLTLNNDM